MSGKYTFIFGFLGLLLVADAFVLQGFGWLLLWPAFSFFWVAAAYAGLGPGLFGKRPRGQMAWWAILVLLPFLLLTWGLWHVQRLVSKEDCWNEVAPGLFLGRRAFVRELPPGVTLVVDLTAEFNAPRGMANGRTYVSLPVLDNRVPRDTSMRELVERVAAWPGPVYLHCAAGHGRSALVVTAVLIARGLAKDVKEAETLVRRARPGVRLGKLHRDLLERNLTLAERRPLEGTVQETAET